MNDTLSVFVCPDCQLVQSRFRTVPVNESWAEWQCWACGHVFGGFCDAGELDLGLTNVEGS